VVEDLLSHDYPIAMADEVREDVKDLRLHRDTVPGAPQLE
jgi:hypothetical protein